MFNDNVDSLQNVLVGNFVNLNDSADSLRGVQIENFVNLNTMLTLCDTFRSVILPISTTVLIPREPSQPALLKN